MAFTKAVRQQAKLRLALTGPSGSGKTYSALLIAKGIGGRIAVIDTEKGSASLYSDLVDFDRQDLAPPYAPEHFIAAMDEAAEAGYGTLIIDSATHEWNGVGGCLELVDEIARARYKGNSWSAWNDVTPRHRAFTDAILRSPMHIIVTMRSKTETAQTEENGRKRIVKLGMKAEQRDGTEYEFTTVLDIVHDGHYAIASKDRTGLFTDQDPQKLTEETGKMLLAWLENGAPPAPEPAPTLLSETEIADHNAAIEASADMPSLKKAFSVAHKAAQAVGDAEAITIFTVTKDARKAALADTQPA